ncbi:flagellin [Alkalicaulis satelles]|uniref:Flagellin n=1 Tax=Alkalicaulis satelles TaxID=2609175 RepID=A0A5M6ZEA7_9PROT|nr:flagellin [Alkalicaulis satelles]KAA5802224.1 flagellin [Alkalicaulis satelles]
MATINTNPGAMIALQNLNKTNSELMQVQNRINTGLAVSSAKDNGGIYAIAQNMRAEVGGLRAVNQSLDLAVSVTDVALAAGEAISDLLIEMKEKALAASDTSLDTASRSALNEDFTALRDQITTIVENAEFNGINLIDGSVTGGISALANADGSNTINVTDEDMNLGGSIVTLAAAASFATSTQASDLADDIETSLNNINSALARLGTASKSLEIHKTFVGKLSDTLEKGIGNLVDADLAKESARLQSLQVKQQLGIQALSIANSAPSTVLGFFR